MMRVSTLLTCSGRAKRDAAPTRQTGDNAQDIIRACGVLVQIEPRVRDVGGCVEQHKILPTVVAPPHTRTHMARGKREVVRMAHTHKGRSSDGSEE